MEAVSNETDGRQTTVGNDILLTLNDDGTLDVNATSDGEQTVIVSTTQKGQTQYVKMTFAVEMPTSVNDVAVNSDIESVTYYNVSGHSSDKPFEGVNIVVTRHADGTVSTAKVIR